MCNTLVINYQNYLFSGEEHIESHRFLLNFTYDIIYVNMKNYYIIRCDSEMKTVLFTHKITYFSSARSILIW